MMITKKPTVYNEVMSVKVRHNINISSGDYCSLITLKVTLPLIRLFFKKIKEDLFSLPIPRKSMELS